jgi:hypothetical protein
MQEPDRRIAYLATAFLLAVTAIAQDATKPRKATQDQVKPAQKHMVRFSFKQGATRYSIIELDMTMTMNMGAKDLTTKIKTTIWTTTTVKATKGNTADIEQKVTRIKAVADSLMIKVNYDSADSDSDPGELEALEELVGETTNMLLTDRGKTLEIQVPEAANNMQPASVDLNELIKSTVTELPDQPIAVGETWKIKQKIPIGDSGEADGVMHYKLLAIDKHTITLQQRLEVDTTEVQIPGINEFTIAITGTIHLDLMTGAPIKMDMASKTEMNGAMDMTIDMQQKIKPAAAPKTKSAKPTTGEPSKTGK